MIGYRVIINKYLHIKLKNKIKMFGPVATTFRPPIFL